MSWRFSLGCIVVGAGLIWGGAQGLHDGLGNSTPTDVTVDELAKNKPEKTWLHVTGGSMFLVEGAFSQKKGGEMDEAFVPLTTKDALAQSQPYHVVVRTRRPGIMATARDLRRMDKMTEDQVREYTLQNMDRLFVAGDVQGMVEWGLRSDDEIRRQLQKGGHLAQDFIVIRDGDAPETGRSVGLLVGGIALVVVGGIMLLGINIRRKAPERRERTTRLPVESRAPEEPKVIDVGDDFAKELGLELAQEKPKTKKVAKTGVVKKPAEGAVAKKPVTKKVLPANAPVAAKPVTKKISSAPVAEETPAKARPKPLLPKKRPLSR